MLLTSDEIIKIIKERISNFDIKNNSYYIGSIISINDGIMCISGLSKVMYGEILELPNNKFALVLNLEKDFVGAVVIGSCCDLVEGMQVKSTGKFLQVPVGYSLLGRVVNALGIPVDEKGMLKCEDFFSVENPAPGVIDRVSVNEPIHTGYKAIDTMIPIGKGQRELIIGDRQTGKTTLAIDTIINQRNTGIKCIYVAIGQKQSTVVNIVNTLKKYNALSYTIVVISSASESAVLQYISPYAGCSMGEFFRNRGDDALIVYDDLSKHAIAYRQISLLLRRPPGREAYPGDIFYLHSRLLERASRVGKNYISNYISDTEKKNNLITGSLTALPIIETQSGDISSFIPTNVISITDGQIFLESGLFNSGIRPAINPGISVSRVGSAAQMNIMKKLSVGIRTALAQYRELVSFSQFSSDLDELTKKQLFYGQKITELLKQKQHDSMSISQQVFVLYAAEYGYLDNIKIEKISLFEKSLLSYVNNEHKKFSHYINKTGIFNSDIKNKIEEVLLMFKNSLHGKIFFDNF